MSASGQPYSYLLFVQPFSFLRITFIFLNADNETLMKAFTIDACLQLVHMHMIHLKLGALHTPLFLVHVHYLQ